MAITYAKEILNFSGVVSSYNVTKNGLTIFVPKNPDNKDYQELLQAVANAEVTITPAS